MKKGGVIFKK